MGMRKFFGNLCGGSRKKHHEAEDESPVTKAKEDDDRDAAEPTIKAQNSKNNVSEDGPCSDKPSFETLDGSPRIYRKEETSETDLSMQRIFDVAPMTPEMLGIATTDKIFEDAVDVLTGFIEESKNFRNVLLKFERRYSKDKRPDFKKCFHVHLRNKDVRKSQELVESEGSSSHFGIDEHGDDSVDELLKLIQTNGKTLLEITESTKPKLDSLIEDAEKHDTKEYVKEKIEEEGQHGLLSKFSAPGKYRRNMKQLKKQRKFLDDVSAEVHSILSTIEEEDHKRSCEVIAEDNTKGEPSEPSKPDVPQTIIVDVNEVVISKPLLSLDAEETVDLKEETKEAKEQKENEPGSEILSELDQHGHLTHSPAPSSVVVESEITQELEQIAEHENEIIFEEKQEKSLETEPLNESTVHNESQISEHEKADVILPLRPSSPSISLMKAKITDSADRLDENKLVDYGSYLVLDPTANDEMQMMRRSRSLDSLSSLGSRRSLSRYGSYEFVTDYEIKIADKAETEKARKTEKAPPQIKTNAPVALLPETKKPMDRHATPQIYKYTEIEYYPLGL